jgi:hypothetical protein
MILPELKECNSASFLVSLAILIVVPLAGAVVNVMILLVVSVTDQSVEGVLRIPSTYTSSCDWKLRKVLGNIWEIPANENVVSEPSPVKVTYE